MFTTTNYQLRWSRLVFSPSFVQPFLKFPVAKITAKNATFSSGIDEILSRSGIEEEFIELSIQQKQPNFTKMTAAQKYTEIQINA